jgi:hypothetical protein
MDHVSNHRLAYTSSLPCIRPHHRQPGPVISTVAAAAVPVLPFSPRRSRVLASAAMAETMWAWRIRGTSCPREAHREKVSKSRSTGSTSAPPPLFLINLTLRRRVVAGLSCLCTTFCSDELVAPISSLIPGGDDQPLEVPNEEIWHTKYTGMGCTGTFPSSRKGVFVCGLSPCARG